MIFSCICIYLFILTNLVKGQSFLPSAAPALTRSPYLNAWLNLNAWFNLDASEGDKSNEWLHFWTGDHILGWTGFLRVDENITYQWAGPSDLKLPQTKKPKQPATLKNVFITPTRTILFWTAGPIQFNITYLSPIEPGDTVLQSFPFSYILLDAVSTDNQVHRLQIYSEVSGEWLSHDLSAKIQWEIATDPIFIQSIQPATPISMQENGNMTSDGTLYFATNPGNGATYQLGASADSLRSWFVENGSLNNTVDSNFRKIDDWPFFSYAHDVGSVKTDVTSVVWAIGLVRNPIIQQPDGSSLSAYWTTRYNDINKAIQEFLTDAPNAQIRTRALDEKIQNDALKVSPTYSNLVSLATRQTFAGIETALGPSNQTYMFMKDVGISGRVSPVEMIYAAFPAYLYLNSTWGKYLLEPLLQYQASAQLPFAAPDLGSTYPIAAGHLNSNPPRSIDDSSSMIIMAWAQAKFSGDQTLLNRYYSTLKTWADYIISSNALFPSAGLQTVDGLGLNNMTNLAIKGIIGVRAMADISHTVGQGNDASMYKNQALSWASSWQNASVSNGHLVSTYSDSESWSLMYNLFPDKLLGMNLISQETYDAQDNFYQTLPRSKFGFSYDSNAINIVKTHWTMLTAATTRDLKTRDLFVGMVYNKVVDYSGSSSKPWVTAFPSIYNSIDGSTTSGSASPAQGAMFSLLALNLQSKLAGLSENAGGSPGHRTNVGAIAGGVIGGLAGVLLILGLAFFIRRHLRRRDQEEERNSELPTHRNSHTQNLPAEYHIEPMPLPTGDYTAPSSKFRPQYVPPTLSSEALSDTRTDPAVMTPPTPSVTSSSEAFQLRNEIASLRREMEEMRLMELPPPGYT